MSGRRGRSPRVSPFLLGGADLRRQNCERGRYGGQDMIGAEGMEGLWTCLGHSSTTVVPSFPSRWDHSPSSCGGHDGQEFLASQCESDWITNLFGESVRTKHYPRLGKASTCCYYIPEHIHSSLQKVFPVRLRLVMHSTMHTNPATWLTSCKISGSSPQSDRPPLSSMLLSRHRCSLQRRPSLATTLRTLTRSYRW